MIRVMSFNIRTGSADDGENAWPRRREMAVERVRAFNPHLMGLQECHDTFQAGYLKQALDDYQFIGVPRGGLGQAGLEMSAVFYQPAAFEVLGVRHFWLSQTPDVPGSWSWDADFPRTVAQVHLRQLETGRELVFLNTHFDYIPHAARELARLLRVEMEALPEGLPLLVTGDFNARKGLAAYRTLLGGRGERRLVDVYRQVHAPGSQEGTFHDFGRLDPPQAIDWILASPQFEVLDAGVDPFHQGNTYPSDHFPLWAELELRT